MRWIGLDVHHLYIQVSELDGDGQVLHYREPMSDAGVEALKQRLGSDANVVLEASTSSFHLYDELVNHAQRVVVCHPAQTRGASALHVKTDQRDSEILARLLMTGFVRPVWVPPVEERGIRALVELRHNLVVLRTGFVNRGKARLRENRMEYPGGSGKGLFFEQFDTITWPDRSLEIYAKIVTAMGQTIRLQLASIDKALADWTDSKPEAQLLLTIPGVGILLGATILSEIGDVRRFGTPSELCAYAGLVPRVRASGKTTRHGGLAHNGRQLIRRALWLALRASQG